MDSNRERPTPKSREMASPELQAIMERCGAEFWHGDGANDTTIHVPDRKLGHRQYHHIQISAEELQWIRMKLDRGEDISGIVDCDPPKRGRPVGNLKRIRK